VYELFLSLKKLAGRTEKPYPGIVRIESSPRLPAVERRVLPENESA
jgi:hypothetical protein